MQNVRETVTAGSILGIVALGLVTTAWIMPGYSFADERIVDQRAWGNSTRDRSSISCDSKSFLFDPP